MQEKYLTKFLFFHDKTLNKSVINWIHPNIIKAICDKPTANFQLNGEKLKAFSLRSRKNKKIKYAHSHRFFSTQYYSVMATIR